MSLISYIGAFALLCEHLLGWKRGICTLAKTLLAAQVVAILKLKLPFDGLDHVLHAYIAQNLTFLGRGLARMRQAA